MLAPRSIGNLKKSQAVISAEDELEEEGKLRAQSIWVTRRKNKNRKPIFSLNYGLTECKSFLILIVFVVILFVFAILFKNS